jgi:hypothetical protein
MSGKASCNTLAAHASTLQLKSSSRAASDRRRPPIATISDALFFFVQSNNLSCLLVAPEMPAMYVAVCVDVPMRMVLLSLPDGPAFAPNKCQGDSKTD